jgi:hypothetical protein
MYLQVVMATSPWEADVSVCIIQTGIRLCDTNQNRDCFVYCDILTVLQWGTGNSNIYNQWDNAEVKNDLQTAFDRLCGRQFVLIVQRRIRCQPTFSISIYIINLPQQTVQMHSKRIYPFVKLL